ncbi:MAG TPA: enolase C-terminal domain-like protein, partial [Bacteroidia bacterium]|nr:enolase C-terminal domain-like protein [Bacteroidia bacterium]
MHDTVPIKSIRTSAYVIPTNGPEGDGTLDWDSTTMVLVEIQAGGKTGLGYTYGHEAIVQVIEKTFKRLLQGMDALQVPFITETMMKAIRNNGNCGIAMMAVSAVDIALWDLKAKLFDIPLTSLLGTVQKEILLYGSGGFTSYNDSQLEEQLGAWVDMGIKHVKIKIGRSLVRDMERVQLARRIVGRDVELYIDANGAYNIREAISIAHKFEGCNISWFEEP